MSLVADRLIGSQYTLSGMMNSYLIQSPICEGDNLEFDGVVYHIEGVQHSASISEDGVRTARTTLSLSNGMRSDSDNVEVGSNEQFPIYAGFRTYDSTGYDPGHAADGSITTGDVSDKHGNTDEEKQRYRDSKAKDAQAAADKRKQDQDQYEADNASGANDG